VLTQNEATLTIEHKAIGARLAAARGFGCVAGRLQVNVATGLCIPAHDHVMRDIGEQEKAAVTDPDRAFAPRVPFANDLKLCVWGNELVKRWIEAYNLADGSWRVFSQQRLATQSGYDQQN
jgi:hypothetical protein